MATRQTPTGFASENILDINMNVSNINGAPFHRVIAIGYSEGIQNA